MAQKRMFTIKIVDSDAFLDMPLSAQCLYFHLNMRADDDGFVGNPKKIMRMIGASEDDFKLLILKRFLLIFENNVVVIKHWWMHNTLRKDCYHETSYLDEKKDLKIKENKAYSTTEGLPVKSVNEMLTDSQHSVNPELDKNKNKSKNQELIPENPPKKNPKAELFDRVDSYTDNPELREILKKYLQYKLKNSKINLEQWDIQLQNLTKFANGDIQKAITQVTKSYANGYQALVYSNDYIPKKGGAYNVACNQIDPNHDYSKDTGQILGNGDIGF